MTHRHLPLGERGGRWRGALDLLAGRYPAFTLGGPLRGVLPVFHFHDERADSLEAQLDYLASNGYRTITADTMADIIEGRCAVPPRAVMLCFDDAWASVWSTAAPLLQARGFQAVLYVIPGRTVDAASCRPQRGDATGGSPFATWPELRALHASGVCDIQSHTTSHAMVSTTDTPTGFLTPSSRIGSLLSLPLREDAPLPVDHPTAPFVTDDAWGTPLFGPRSRMSDGRRTRHDASATDACVAHVRQHGGAEFFTRPAWDAELRALVHRHATSDTESDATHEAAITAELDTARARIEAGIPGARVRHLCLPWGVTGTVTQRTAARLGIATVVATRWAGRYLVRRGSDPQWIKRLHSRYIYALPGRGRRWMFLG